MAWIELRGRVGPSCQCCTPAAAAAATAAAEVVVRVRVV